MLPPTIASLQQLARYRSAREMLDAYGDDATEWGPAKVVGDERCSYEVLLPGDPGYDTAVSRTENSWVRLPAHAASGG
jgi:hypothetical protein